MYETEEYVDKKTEQVVKGGWFSVTYFGVILTLIFNAIFYTIALVAALSLDSAKLLIASWAILGLLVLELASVITSAILKVVKKTTAENNFKAGIFKSIARLSGFLVGIALIVYSALLGTGYASMFAVAVIECVYGVISILIGFPMFLWSIFHLSVVTVASIPDEPNPKKKKTKKTKENDDVVYTTKQSSSYEQPTTQQSTSNDDAIEVEVHDINEA